ncbi:glycosyltransferase [Cohnella yongneupensis]|uniref:Glycosyltransferase n=1 Tax=Cohnella yongneupensis TaxID=425006 RepID=A0ABW0QXV2_9BACL
MDKLISVCMIVKNEEAFLQRCLQSVRAYVDEIVIVDTGSTDRTKEIAQTYTDKIYDFVWINDFSAARNESLKHATGKWILVMDADEYMEEKEIRGMRDFLAKEKPTNSAIYQLCVRNFQGEQNNPTVVESQVARVFANRMKFHYHRALHEQPRPAKGVSPRVVEIPYQILHSGYLSHVMTSKNKHERNLSIFNDMKADGGFNAYDHCMIGLQLATMKKDEEALQHLRIALESGDKKAVWYRSIIFAMLEISMRHRRFVESLNLMDQHLQAYIQYPDIKCLRGVILLELGFRELSKQEFLAAYQEAEKRSANKQEVAIANPDYGMRMPLWQLALGYERENNLNESVTYLTRLLMANDKDLSAMIKLIEILSLKDNATNIAAFLNKLLHVNGDVTKTNVIKKIAISIGNKELARHYATSSINQVGIADRLKYAILMQDQHDFDLALMSYSQQELEELTVVKIIVLGGIVWSRSDWLERYAHSTNEEVNGFLRFATTVLKEHNPPADDAQFEHAAFETLSQLYVLKQWVAYDRLIETYGSPPLINQLASFFLLKHYKEPAMQYYQHLLDNGQLTAESCDQLAFLQTIEGDPEDALEFWKHAIEIKPDNPKLYIQFLAHCSDPERRAPIKMKLIERYPEYTELALLKV